VDSDTDTQVARVGTEVCLKVLNHGVEGHHAVARESGHDERVVLARFRDAARRDVAVSDRFDLARSKWRQYPSVNGGGKGLARIRLAALTLYTLRWCAILSNAAKIDSSSVNTSLGTLQLAH
jgi:hypothetical protein